MGINESIELFFSQSYEKDIDKLIRDDRNFVIPYEQLLNYVNSIISIPYKEFIGYLLSHPLKKNIEAKDITQSSSFSACEIEMCNALLSVDNPGLNFVEIGKLFPQYISHPNESAYRKYGENQIKTSAHLGLVYEYYKYWYLSCLGYIYPRLSETVRMKLLARTILRAPLYYRMMVDLYYQSIESTKYMNTLSRATQQRREGSVCRLMEICLDECKRSGVHMHKLTRATTIESRSAVVYDLFDNIIDAAAESSGDDKKKVARNKTSEDANKDEGESEEDDAFQIISHVELDDIEYTTDEISDSFRLFLANVHKYDLLTEEEIQELLRKYLDGDKKAYEQLMEGHLRYVVALARLFRNTGVPFEDIVQEGILGLHEAIKKYRYWHNWKFSLFAQISIYSYLDQSLRRIQYHVKIYHRHIYLHRLIRQSCDDYVQREEMEPPFEFVEIKENVSPGVLEPIFNLPPDLQDIIVPKNDWDDVPDETFLADNEMMSGSLRFELLYLIHTLPPRMCEILESHFGLNGKPEETLDIIGTRMNLTRERVRQIKEKGVRILRGLIRAKRNNCIPSELKKLKGNLYGNQFTASSEESVNHQSDIDKIKKKQEATQIKSSAPKEAKPSIEKRYHKALELIMVSDKDDKKVESQTSLALTVDEEYIEENKQRTVSRSSIIDPKALMEVIRRVLEHYSYSISLEKITAEINQPPYNYDVQPMSVKYALGKMNDEVCTYDGNFYFLKGRSVPTSERKDSKKEPSKSTLFSSSAQPAKSENSFTVSTRLQQLVDLKLITRKECKHCHHKGLYSIGDVQEMIQRHHLTRESTRFTKYTLDIWFKIIDLLENVKEPRHSQEEKPTKQNGSLDRIFNNYIQYVQRIRQSKKYGIVNPAKPVLLLSVIDGIENNIFSNNHIHLNEWLETRYEKQMQKYSHGNSTSPINNPFWHLQSDGFWHLHFRMDERITTTPTTKWLEVHVLFASFDDDLWKLLDNKEMRQRLRDYIIEHKLSGGN